MLLRPLIPQPSAWMALLFLVAAMASPALASTIDRSHFHLEPEIVLDRYEAGPLECYNWNNMTRTSELEVCHAEGPHSLANNTDHPIAAYPVCMIIKITQKDKTITTQSCVYFPSNAVVDCEKSLCLEVIPNNGRFSSCCCTSSGCNNVMLPRPHPVSKLPDKQ